MKLDLTGKRALVCGSTQGIGRACALELASLGAGITLVARDKAKLQTVAAELPVHNYGQYHAIIVADFTKPDSVRQAVAEEMTADRPYHIVINNTGGPPPGAAIDAPAEQYLAAFNAQVIVSHLLAQLLVPAMKVAKYGRIINITSTSVKQPIANLGISNTVRAAVAAWAKSLSMELGPFGITVNNVLPGFTATERLASLVKNRATKSGTDEATVKQEMMATIPAGRFAGPEEVAAAVAFLASPAAAYINGINLPVDGGRLGTL